jgi:hypothetical protein
MINNSNDLKLASDMINVHGREAALRTSRAGEVLDPGARDHPAAAGR